MRTTLPLLIALSCFAGAAHASLHRGQEPSPKIKANRLAPGRVCTAGRACGDSCQTKKLA